MAADQPRCSVVIRAYNEEKHIGRLLTGIMEQTVRDVQVILVDISMRDAFDALWQAWIGPDPQHWPQRAVHGGALAPGLLLEVMATAARSADGAA